MVRATDEHVYQVDKPALMERARRPLSALPRPILRWAGSKQRLLPDLVNALPDAFGTYYEPFSGSGALFFLLQPDRAALGDTCVPVIDLYRTIARAPGEVYEALSNLNPLDKEMYYRVRAERPTEPVRQAANFIYLNRSCWNGLYRVNSRGEFNVPYGAPKTSTLPSREHVVSCGSALGKPGVRVAIADFEESVADAQAGDLVFFDPPYVTGHNNNGFVDYNETLFRWADQERLAACARALRDSGVHVIITNADHDAIRTLYSDFRIVEVSRMSTLANNKQFRRRVTEALIYS